MIMPPEDITRTKSYEHIWACPICRLQTFRLVEQAHYEALQIEQDRKNEEES
jgi:hypothetical protein